MVRLLIVYQHLKAHRAYQAYVQPKGPHYINICGSKDTENEFSGPIFRLELRHSGNTVSECTKAAASIQL